LTQTNYKELNVLYDKYKNQGKHLNKKGKERNLSTIFIMMWICKTETSEWFPSPGFEILAFPCNQFAGQEPGNNEEIQEVVCTRFKAEFPIFDKVISDKW